ncbi:hypothetical protein HYR54_15365 [Candidatus Acetothermia bacterium]|nr:hypothetical protein [Candidatus Acetothermia bacterium]
MRCETPRTLYMTGWTVSDPDGVFTYAPEKFPGFSERTRRRWAARLVQWRVWEIVDTCGGRGKHSIYRVKGKAEFLKKQAHENGCKQQQEKPGHEAKDKRIKTAVTDTRVSSDQKSAWKKDPIKRREFFFAGWCQLKPGAYGWDKCAQAFRIPLEELGLSKSAANSVTGLLLFRLKGSSCEMCKKVYVKFGEYLWKSRDRLFKLLRKGLQKLSAWVGWILSKLLQGETLDEPKSKRGKLWAINQRLRDDRHRKQCECIECERERIEQRRKVYEQRQPVVRSQSNNVVQPQKAEWEAYWEREQEQAREQWLIQVRDKAVAHKLEHVRDGFEIFVLAFDSLYARRPTDAELQSHVELLCESFQLDRKELAGEQVRLWLDNLSSVESGANGGVVGQL